MFRVVGVVVVLGTFSGCASRDAPTKTTSDTAVDSVSPNEAGPQEDSVAPPLDTAVPADTPLPDTSSPPADTAED